MTTRAEPLCFVCDADEPRESERPWEWAPPRMLCRRHERDVRLPDGQPLRDVLARVAPPQGPLEGSLLGWIFNPVVWRGPDGREVRAWTDFAAGGLGLLEDRYGAADYFDFHALTSPAALDFLYALRLALDDPSAPRPVPGGNLANMGLVYAACRCVSNAKGPAFWKRPNDGLSRLMDRWNSAALLADRRAQAGRAWPQSFDELEQWLSMSGLAHPDVPPVGGRSFYVVLGALAQRRFPTILAEG
ncbi:MAG TPA: hypothetical protein VFK70_03005 [Vicinamibacteria bacterium]|nr:hypothetical protein [Vicinamibacteria bacterium]